MKNNNYISYICEGERIVNFSLLVNKKEDIQVYMNNSVIDPSRYVLNNVGMDNQNLTFLEPIGEKGNPSILTIIVIPRIERKTNFQNQSQVSVKSLNLELDNIVRNQNIIYEYIKNSVKADINTPYILFLPKPKKDSMLCWDENGNIVNSQENIQYFIDNINILREKINKFSQYDDNSMISPSKRIDNHNNSNPVGQEGEGGGKILSNQISYINGSIANISNIFDVVEFLHKHIITLTNNHEDISNQISDVQKNIDNLFVKIENYSTQLVDKSHYNGSYLRVSHAILAAKTNSKGYTDFLFSTSKDYEVGLKANDKEPFIVSFSKNRMVIEKEIEQDLFLQVSPTKEIIYIYIDLDENNNIKLGYNEKKPFYIHHNPNASDSMFILDKYDFQGDYFYIPSNTMYTKDHTAVNRIYIGQVKFKESGRGFSFCNNYALGNSIVFDINLEKIVNSSISFNNPFGVDNLLYNVYFKSKFPPMSYENINYVPLNIIYREEGVGNVLKYGIRLSISNTEIQCITGARFTQTLSTSSSIFDRATNKAILRVVLNRGF